MMNRLSVAVDDRVQAEQYDLATRGEPRQHACIRLTQRGSENKLLRAGLFEGTFRALSPWRGSAPWRENWIIGDGNVE